MGTDNLLIGALVAAGGYLVMKSMNETPVPVVNGNGNGNGLPVIEPGGGNPVVIPVDLTSVPLIVNVTVDDNGLNVIWAGPVTDLLVQTDQVEAIIPINAAPGGRINRVWGPGETFVCVTAMEDGVANENPDDIQCRPLTVVVQQPIIPMPVIITPIVPQIPGIVVNDPLTQAYWDIFGREPDAVGYAYWSASGLSIQEIRNIFINSEEGQLMAAGGGVVVNPGVVSTTNGNLGPVTDVYGDTYTIAPGGQLFKNGQPTQGFEKDGLKLSAEGYIMVHDWDRPETWDTYDGNSWLVQA